jgi:hypothetical protein
MVKSYKIVLSLDWCLSKINLLRGWGWGGCKPIIDDNFNVKP